MKNGYKFNSQHYITSGIQANVPPIIQAFLWKCIDDLTEKIPLDYLQIFNLRKEIKAMPIQYILHSQEQPTPFDKEHSFEFPSPINAKIYIIDDIDHVTMLLSEEY